jgi:hypothetical protein
MLMRKLSLTAALIAAPALSLAQDALVCVAAPGARLGIVAIECANCTIRQKDGRREQATYSFGAEPVVAETRQGSLLAKGDVIEAIDGLAITTPAGADRFASPADGNHTVTVRRGRERQAVTVSVPRCFRPDVKWIKLQPPVLGAPGDDGIRSGVGYGTGRGVGTPPLGGEPLFVIDGVVQPPTGVTQIGRFGFAVECRPSCSNMRMPDGSYAYKYDGYPIVAAVRLGTPADRAGLHVGDEIRTINGRSIVADDALVGTEAADDLRLVVRRNGKDLSLVLTAPR